MRDSKRDTDVKNRLLDSGRGQGWDDLGENSIETCRLSSVKRTASPGSMHERALRADALGRPRGMGWGGRWEGGSGWGHMADSCQCMAKTTTKMQSN